MEGVCNAGRFPVLPPRATAPPGASKLSDHLSLRFGDDIVFRDVDDLQPGMRWRREIDAALRGAEVVLVLIGPQWFAARQRRRLADPKDVLRQEIATALEQPAAQGGTGALGGGRDAGQRGVARGAARAVRLAGLRRCATGSGGATWRRWSSGCANWCPAWAGSDAGPDPPAPPRRAAALLRSAGRQPARVRLPLARATMRAAEPCLPAPPPGCRVAARARLLPQEHRHGLAAHAAPGSDGDRRSTKRSAPSAPQCVERPRDAGRLERLGSVAALRGQPKRALRHVDKALELAPDYAAALHDRQQLLAGDGSRLTPHAHCRRAP